MTKEIASSSSSGPITQKLICPVCLSELREMTKGHINSKKHTKALKSKGIDSSEDPALAMIPVPRKKLTVDEKIDRLEERIVGLEDIMYQLLLQQETILNHYNLIRAIPKKNQPKNITTHDILEAIYKCTQRNRRKKPWVKIDDVVELLELTREVDIINFNKMLTSMFNKKMIDLADAGNSKHPIIFENRTYGKVASKVKLESITAK